MTDVKLIALDLDGTLLDEDKKIPPSGVTALRQARARDIQIAICTGRNHTDILYFARILGMALWGVSANGAYVCATDSGKPVYKNPLDAGLTDEVIRLCREYGTTPCLHTPCCEYTGEAFARIVDMLREQGIQPFFNPQNKYIPVPDEEWEQVAGRENGCFTKGIIYHDSLETVAEMETRLREHGGFEVSPSVMFRGTMRNLEVNRKGVSKGAALEALSRRLGFGMEQVMAIGDSENDLTMLRMSGYGVAMGNAAENIKSAARFVTGSNQENGVAYAVRRWALGWKN